MKSFLWLVFFAVLLFVQPAHAGTISTCTTPAGAISCTGTLDTPEDVFLESFTLTSSSDITVQTYGFGGGTNAAGTTISAGGFDSFVGLFSGTPTSASILMSGGNSIASDPATTQFSSGCGPAGMVTIGSGATAQSVCGDNTLTADLGPGTYTLLLSDADYEPYSFNPGDSSPYDLTSASSYGDLTGGVFQTCDSNGDCISDNGNFAVDITGLSVVTPEPSTFVLLGFGLVGLAYKGRREAKYDRAR